MKDYTLVIGTDMFHLEQLKWTWPTWKLHKPSLLKVPMICFYDESQVTKTDIWKVIDHPRLTLVPWPPEGIEYRLKEGRPNDKWNNPKRHRMLSGFVHVPPMTVMTRYWLKLDTDVVAKGTDDWIDDEWFEDCPAIVAHKWGYTKPPDQMVNLDRWVEQNREIKGMELLANKGPLNIYPKAGCGTLRHGRIASWCAFFHTRFTAKASVFASRSCGVGKIPEPSQDGYMWYCAKRMGFGIRRLNMKGRGWRYWSTMKNVIRHSKESLGIEEVV